MSLPTFFVEFLPRIEIAQVNLAGRSTERFSFTKNSITYHSPDDEVNDQGGRTNSEGTTQLCSWISPELSIKSCREMKLVPKESLSMRFEIARDVNQTTRGAGFPACPGFIVPKDELAEYGAEQCQLSLKCAFCQMELSLKEYVFNRVLPLPSDGWEELSGNFFCHTHKGEEVDHTDLLDDAKLVPKEGSCLISCSQLIIRGSVLDVNRVVIRSKDNGDTLHCQRCMLCLGIAVTDQGASTDTKDAMVFQIHRSKLQLVETKCLPSVKIKDNWKNLENYLARRLITFSMSKAAFQFKVIDHEKRAYLTVWMLNVISRMFFAPTLVSGRALVERFTGPVEREERLTDSKSGHDAYKSALVLKLLFECELVDKGHRPDFSTNSESLEMSSEECLILVLLLIQSNRIIPPSQRVTNQLQIFKEGDMAHITF